MEIFDGRYEQEQLLGQGAFSEVWKVKDTQTGVTLALKIYNPTTGIDEDGNEMLTHEFALMVNANHKNLLRPLFFASCDNRPYLILPYCEKGNIGKFIGKMNEDEAWRLLRDCSSALAYLHAMNPPILHQDIKPTNILLSDQGDYMLTDFGVSTQMKQSMSRVSNQDMALLSAGTISYMAPERFSRNNLPIMANDIYSLGSTVYEMVSGGLPFGNDGGLLQKKGAEIPELQGNFSPLLKKTLDDCLQEEPWQRPTAEQLEEIATRAIRHPELRNIVPQRSPSPDIQAKATTMQLPDEYMQDTPHMAQRNPMAGTVIGSATHNVNSGLHNVNSGIHNVSPSMGQTVVGSSPVGYPPMEEKKNNRMLYGIFAAIVVVVAIGAGIFFLGGNSEKDGLHESAINTDSLMKVAEAAEFDACMNLFRSNQPDSIQSAMVRISALAEKGHREAIHQVAYTYAPIPNDTESDRRKRLLGWKIDKNGLLTTANDNRQAIEWINRSIMQSDSTDYQALYWLTSYYLNGIIVERNFTKSLHLLTKASNEAAAQQDFVTKNKIDEIITQLKQIK